MHAYIVKGVQEADDRNAVQSRQAGLCAVGNVRASEGCSGLTLPNLLRLSLFRSLACRRSRHPDPHLVVLPAASAGGVLHLAVLAGLAEVPVHHPYNVHLCNRALLLKLLNSHWGSLRADVTCRGSYQASSHCRRAKRPCEDDCPW